MQFVIVTTVPLSIENSETCRVLVDICYVVINKLLGF